MPVDLFYVSEGGVGAAGDTRKRRRVTVLNLPEKPAVASRSKVGENVWV